jgi:hypothetical protein
MVGKERVLLMSKFAVSRGILERAITKGRLRMSLEHFELKFSDIIGTTCRYPKMYFMHGTFGEALAYLEGYADGRGLGSIGHSSSVFNPFREWLSSKLALQNTEDFWTTFRNLYANDQDALKHFSEYWSEYNGLP